MFSKAWTPIHTATPTATRRPKASARRATTAARATMNPMSRMIPRAPTKPSSSPATEKMKSVSWKGIRPDWVWLPWKRPSPSRPPEAIAIRTWRVW